MCKRRKRQQEGELWLLLSGWSLWYVVIKGLRGSWLERRHTDYPGGGRRHTHTHTQSVHI